MRRERRHLCSALLTLATVVVVLVAAVGCTDDDGKAGGKRAGDSTSTTRVRDGFVVKIEPEAAAAAADAGVDLDRIVDDTLARVADQLPGLETVVTFEVSAAQVIPEIGIGGYAHSISGEMVVALPPGGVEAKALRVWLPEVLAHEAHHSLRILQGPPADFTLGESMIREGLATVSAREAFPATPPQPWAHALSDLQLRELWAIAQPLLDPPPGPSSRRLYLDWFFGGGGIPRWTGYTLGVELVTAYLADHPGTTAAALVREPASTIIAGSGYDPGPPDPDRPRCFTDHAQTREGLCDEFDEVFNASAMMPENRKCYIVRRPLAAEVACITEGAADDA